MLKSLVVGYGNSLRSDDGIGVCVAKTVEKWNMPQVRSLANHQLTPELAAELAQVDLAIFIDACQTNETDTIKLFPLKPSESMVFRSHFNEPQALLSLTKALFGKCPQAFWVVVPGVDFQLGDRLSPMAKLGIEQALKLIRGLLEENIRAEVICTKSV
ncbi:MAG: hydrogenase maturation protease [Cyanobacteria bacterium J06643_13]